MKLVLLGGASVRSVFFTNGVAHKSVLMGIDELILFDIDQRKLEVMEALCIHAVKAASSPLRVSACCDARQALTGANYIVSTIRVGCDQSRVADEEICLKNGVLGQETTGAGGFSMALRTIPVMLGYMKLIQEVAPNAWVFNFTNPSGLVTQALRDAGYDRVLGICDAPSGTKLNMAKALNIPVDELFVQFIGLNHLSWVASVRHSDRELLPELLRDETFPARVKDLSMFGHDLISTIGHLPNEYLYYYYYREKALQNFQGCKMARGRMVLENNNRMFEQLYAMNPATDIDSMLDVYLHSMYKRESTYMNTETNQILAHAAFESTIPGSEGYAGVMMNFILAAATGQQREMVLSMPAGQAFGMRKQDVLEVTCLTSGGEIKVQSVGQLSPPAMALMRSVKEYENLTVQAVMQRCKRTAAAALTIHPLVNDFEKASRLVDAFWVEAAKYAEGYEVAHCGNRR